MVERDGGWVGDWVDGVVREMTAAADEFVGWLVEGRCGRDGGWFGTCRGCT